MHTSWYSYSTALTFFISRGDRSPILVWPVLSRSSLKFCRKKKGRINLGLYCDNAERLLTDTSFNQQMSLQTSGPACKQHNICLSCCMYLLYSTHIIMYCMMCNSKKTECVWWQCHVVRSLLITDLQQLISYQHHPVLTNAHSNKALKWAFSYMFTTRLKWLHAHWEYRWKRNEVTANEQWT